MTQNGPIKVVAGEDSKLVQNDHAWSKLIDYIWVEQPVYALHACQVFASG